MSDYPTRKKLIVPPTELGWEMPNEVESRMRGVVSVHHGYFPRNRFEDAIASVFRSLHENTFLMFNTDHNIGTRSLHARYRSGVPRPPDGLMIDFIDERVALLGFVVCVRENQTRSTYKIEEADWNHRRKTYKRRVV